MEKCYLILPIETCIGTLEPVDIFNTSSISPYVINYKNQIEMGNNDTTIRTGDSEIINQFKLLCMFGLRSVFDVDRNYVEILCRKGPKSSTEKIIPTNFVPRFFDYHIHGKYEEIENFKKFVDKTIGLPREQYLAVIKSINAFSQSLQILNYNLDLAYSLMVYSLESLTQKFDKFEPNWEDYEESIQNKLEKLFREEEFEQSTIESIIKILLKSRNLRATKRFIDFTSNHISDTFFKEEADGLKKSELNLALKNAYKMRSNYVHELKEIEISLKYPQILGGGESIRWENKPYITYAGLTRLVHHVINNFIEKQDQLKKERYNWRQDLPGRIQMEIHPKYWIWKADEFTSNQSIYFFSKFLSLMSGSILNDEKNGKFNRLNAKNRKTYEKWSKK